MFSYESIIHCLSCKLAHYWFLMQKKKLIKIDPEVHKELYEVGLRGESFSDIIHRLIKEHKGRAQDEK